MGPEELRYAVVDVETSGRTAGRHRVVQLAVVTARADGTVLDRYATLVAPWGRLPGPTRVHGIERAHLRHAPPFASVAPEVVRRLDGAVFTAHNAAFDWAFVATELYRCGYRPPAAGALCTLRLSRAADVERRLSHRLPDVCERHGVVLAGHHDALADAEATAALLPHLLAAAAVRAPEPVAWPPFPAAGPPARARTAARWMAARTGWWRATPPRLAGTRPPAPADPAQGVMKPEAST